VQQHGDSGRAGRKARRAHRARAGRRRLAGPARVIYGRADRVWRVRAGRVGRRGRGAENGRAAGLSPAALALCSGQAAVSAPSRVASEARPGAGGTRVASADGATT
jgi:hypothetical protein